MARPNDLSEWEKIVKNDFEKTQRLNAKYCQLCGKEILKLSSLSDEQREFEQRNKVHYDCAVAYQMKKQEEREKEITERVRRQEEIKKQEEYKARLAAQKELKEKQKAQDVQGDS